MNKESPLGLIPKYFWIRERMSDIKTKILHFEIAERPIPKEWIEEYEEHEKYVIEYEKKFNLKGIVGETTNE